MRNRIFQVLAVAVALLGVVPAMAWEEPARGTATRKALMDALRPHAEWMLGGEVQFVVYDLRRQGDLAFASVYAQRPGGQAIDLRNTPAAKRGDIDPDFMDGAALQALYVKSGQTWVAVHWSIGATDVWYSWSPYCQVWWPVIGDVC